jgi:hypothetical protein
MPVMARPRMSACMSWVPAGERALSIARTDTEYKGKPTFVCVDCFQVHDVPNGEIQNEENKGGQ